MAIIRNLVVKIGADISGLSRGLKKAQSQITKVSSSLGRIGTSLSMSMTAPLALMAIQALKTSAKFEQSMANAASVSGSTGEELERMTALAREMGKTTVFSASQAADAMYYMASAGYKVEQMASSIEPILNLASATQNDLAFTTDTVISTLNQFGLEASDAGRVTNVFASVIGSSQATLDKLAYSMRYVGPVAKSLGYSLEETSAALGILYNSGFRGEQAGTVLRGALVRLLKPTSDMKGALEEMGIAEEEVNPSTNKLADIIRKLGDAGMTTTQAVRIFGTEAGPGMMAMVGQGADALEHMTAVITDTNAATEMAEKQINTMQGSGKLMKSMMEEIAISIGDVLIPVMRELMEKYVMPLMGNFQGLSDISKELVVKIGLLAASIGPLFIVLSKIVSIVGVVVKVIGMIASPIGLAIIAVVAIIAILFKLFKTNEKFRAKVLAIWEQIKTGIVKALEIVKQWWSKNGETILQSVRTVFETMMYVVMFCISVIISIIQKLISSIMYLWENNKAFRDAIIGIWNGIKQAITSAISYIVAWWEENGQKLWNSITTIFNAIWDVIVVILDQIVKSVTVFLGYLEPIWDQVKSLFMTLWDVIKELWVLLGPLLEVIGGALAVLLAAALGVINGIIQALGPFVQAILDVFEFNADVIGAIISLLTGDLDGAWEHVKGAGESVKSFFGNLWEGIKNLCKGFVDGFLSLFSGFGIDFGAEAKRICGVVGDWFVSLWSGIKDGAVNIWNAITGIFGKIGDWFKNLFKDAFNWGRNLIGSIVDGINSAIEWVGDSIKSVGQKIKDFLGFSSPTKKGPGSTADEWMPNMMDMFAKGINKNLPNIENSVSQTAQTLGNMSGAGMQENDNSGLVTSMLGAMSIIQSNNNKVSSEPVEFNIDGQIFARLILPSITKEFRRNGIILEGI